MNVLLNRTVVADSDWRFDDLCGTHLQGQSELYHVSWWYYTLVIDLIGHLRRDVNWRDTTHFDSEDDHRKGCRNAIHCQQQQSYSGLRSLGRSNSTYFWNDSWVQTHSIYLFINIFILVFCFFGLRIFISRFVMLCCNTCDLYSLAKVSRREKSCLRSMGY